MTLPNVHILLRKQPPVERYSPGLVSDERQGPAGKHQGRLLLIVFQDDEWRTQIVRWRRCKYGLGMRTDDRRIERLDHDRTDQQRENAEKRLSPEQSPHYRPSPLHKFLAVLYASRCWLRRK